ncbi:MAG TPA: PaREP1 family protein [Dehalococcoidales bacterium]|nr:PaREP1 family protein [Dehalococcoidales bacterium]
MDTKKRVKRYKTQSIHYFENALKFIEVGDTEKASEFLWGSMAQALKATAASKDIQLRSHKDIRDYALELARVLPDESIRHTFNNAQSLHSNFYESGLMLEDVIIAAEDVKETVTKLLSFIPKEG